MPSTTASLAHGRKAERPVLLKPRMQAFLVKALIEQQHIDGRALLMQPRYEGRLIPLGCVEGTGKELAILDIDERNHLHRTANRSIPIDTTQKVMAWTGPCKTSSIPCC